MTNSELNIENKIVNTLLFLPSALGLYTFYHLLSVGSWFSIEGRMLIADAYNAHFIALAFCTCWQVCIFSRNNGPRLFWNMFIPTVIIGMGPGLLYDITGAWWTHLLAIFIPLPIAYFSKLCHA